MGFILPKLWVYSEIDISFQHFEALHDIRLRYCALRHSSTH